MRIGMIFIALLVIAACKTDGADVAAVNAGDAPASERVVRSPGKPLHPVQVSVVSTDIARAGIEQEATLVVRSARPLESVEVEMQPQLATVISENRFSRRDDELLRGGALNLPFRYSAASNDAQPVKVIVRATDTTGRVLVREVVLELGAEKATPSKEKRRLERAAEFPEPGDDVVVPAEQEIKRGH